MRTYYKDLMTGKLKYTTGTFKEIKNGAAIFRTAKTYIYIPLYLLTPESRKEIDNIPSFINCK